MVSLIPPLGDRCRYRALAIEHYCLRLGSPSVDYQVRNMKIRVSISNMLWIVALLSLMLGWGLDRRRMSTENATMNQEAADLAELVYSGPFNSPFSVSALITEPISLDALDFTDVERDYSTPEGRKSIRLAFAKANAGRDGYSTMIAKGWDVKQTQAWLVNLGFEIREPHLRDTISARKQWHGGYHFVTVFFENGQVTEVSEMLDDP